METNYCCSVDVSFHWASLWIYQVMCGTFYKSTVVSLCVCFQPIFNLWTDGFIGTPRCFRIVHPTLQWQARCHQNCHRSTLQCATQKCFMWSTQTVLFCRYFVVKCFCNWSRIGAEDCWAAAYDEVCITVSRNSNILLSRLTPYAEEIIGDH
jgi:hypothetical protein